MQTQVESALDRVKNQLEPILSRLRVIYARHPRLIGIAAFASIVFGPPLRRNYNAYIGLGKGGVPNNVVGWAISSLLSIVVGRETLSVGGYAEDPNKDMWLNKEVFPVRRGERPVMSWHAIPQRQMTQRNDDPAMHAKLGVLIQNYAKANPELVEAIVSPHERVHECLSIHPKIETLHKVAKIAWREVLHVHDGSDWSMHATLSPQDCKLVVDNGWGQRHPFSNNTMMPRETLFIYTPRDEDEFRVFETIFRAYIGFMTASRHVQP